MGVDAWLIRRRVRTRWPSTFALAAVVALTSLVAFLAIGTGVGLYYAVSMSWLKLAWGLGAAALVYLVCLRLITYVREPTVASSQRSSSPS